MDFRHAHYSKENYEAAVQAFEDGLKIDPNNANLKTNLENAKAHLPTIGRSVSPGAAGAGAGAGGMPDLSALAGMFGGAGGGGAGGGMPDLASLMSNPQVMEMAQNMMANGGMERLMQNPMMRNMVRQYFPLSKSLDIVSLALYVLITVFFCFAVLG